MAANTIKLSGEKDSSEFYSEPLLIFILPPGLRMMVESPATFLLKIYD
jgi:hypothetical protein